MWSIQRFGMGQNSGKSNRKRIQEPTDFYFVPHYQIAEMDSGEEPLLFFGVPVDVYCVLVGKYLSIKDIGRAACVCKAWRRLCYRDEVWRHVGRRMGMADKLDNVTDSVRARVGQLCDASRGIVFPVRVRGFIE